jgi:hypothetical protein
VIALVEEAEKAHAHIACHRASGSPRRARLADTDESSLVDGDCEGCLGPTA